VNTSKQKTTIIMYINPLQGAALIAAHATFTKMLVSFTLRTYQYLEWDEKRLKEMESKKYMQEFEKAQKNESEYAALLVSLMLYLSSVGPTDVASTGATIAVASQIGYVWMRTVVGYPALPTITLAVVRYGGLALLVNELWKVAF